MRPISFVASAAGAMLALLAVIAPHALAADAGADAGAGSNAVPACMQVTTESRYVPYGYSHIVRLKNGCSKPAKCHVSTDVNPDVQKVDVAANTTIEVVTYLSAASQTFTAKVGCTLAK